MEALTVIRQARAAGLTLEVAGEGLRVAPRERLTPELRELLSEYKPEVLAVLSAANDAPTVEAMIALHGDGATGGVDWSAWKLTTATSSPAWAVVNPLGLTLLLTVEAIPQPRSCAQAWPLERIVPWPEIEDDAADAEPLAREAIQRAAAPCWDCRRLHSATSGSNRLPRCDAGHPLVYRISATRTWPGRSDAADCGDRA